MVRAFGLGGGRVFMCIYVHEWMLLNFLGRIAEMKGKRGAERVEPNAKRLVSSPRMIKKNIAL